MRINLFLIIITFLFANLKPTKAQPSEEQMGAWYMYFYNANFKDSKWGVQGDAQFRNWNLAGDLEQLLLRSGLTYSPEGEKIKFTLGYANITTGEYGSSDATVQENRIYQEALFPHRFGQRFYTNHRFRYEQRFVEDQDFRTRYRYNLFLNVALNKVKMTTNTFYLALYNEIFINGERKIGEGAEVELFDRNRFYSAFGYQLNEGLKVQLGVMTQTTDNWSKRQWQLSLHHSF